MLVARQSVYGSPDVLQLVHGTHREVGPHDLRVQVFASPVTHGDRRLRSADFPGMTAVPGRLMMGITGPRNPVPGTMFAGRIVEVGSAVTNYSVGDDIFGSTDHGAHAEYLVVRHDSSIARLPDGFTHAEAAALPYGALTALIFLRDLAELQPGQSVLVLGAAGGVGRYAVQLARHMGADVTGVCSGADAPFVHALGAHHTIDYASEDFRTNGEQYDVIFDIAGVSGFTECQGSLTPTGRYITVYMTMRVLWQMLWTSMGKGQKAIVGVAMGTPEDMATLQSLAEAGAVRSKVALELPLAQIADAHHALEEGSAKGEVVLLMPAATQTAS